MTAIICALQIEAKTLVEQLENKQEVKILNKIFYTGSIAEEDVVIVVCGVGKVSASVVTTLLIEHFKPSLIINSGIAGGYAKDLKTIDIVVAENVAYYDVDLTADNQEFGRMQGYPKYFNCSNKTLELLKKENNNYHYGTIITADTFANNREYLDKVVSNYYKEHNILAVDMESAAIGQVCYDNKTDFINIRVISDIIGEPSQLDMYYNFIEEASNTTTKVILKIIKNNSM